MFNPSRDQVRQFFIATLQKAQYPEQLTPLEKIALEWILQHPEYHAELSDSEAQAKDYRVENGQTNPFLHLSMHLAIQEQVTIDSPPGVKKIYQQLALRDGEHEASHHMMEALGQIIWEAQRNGAPMNNERYLELLEKLI